MTSAAAIRSRLERGCPRPCATDRTLSLPRHGHRRQDDAHRAARVARARRGRGAGGGGQALHGADRAPARARPAHARLPQGQGARRRSSSSASAARRSSTRRSAARSAAGTSTPSTTRASTRSATPTLNLGDLPGRGRAADLHLRDRRAPHRHARRVQRRRGRPARARAPTTRPSRPRSTRCASAARAWRPSSEPAAERRLRRHGLRGDRSTASPFAGGAGRDQLVELGSGRLMPGFEEQLEGAKAGDERTVTITFPDDYGAEHLAGKTADFAVTVKEVKRKHLPELDDDFAADAAGFDTLEELREDIAGRAARGRRAAGRGRVPRGGARRGRRARRRSRSPTRWSRRARASCGSACCTRSPTRASRARRTCRSPGKDEDELLDEAQARRRAGAAPRGGHRRPSSRPRAIEPSDGDVLDALQATAARENTTPEKLRKRLRQGRPPGRPARGPRPAPRGRPARRGGQADHRGAGAGARQAVDARPRGAPGPPPTPGTRRRPPGCGRLGQ